MLVPETVPLKLQFATSSLRSQIATSSSSGGRQYHPYVFTEQGVAMLSSVLRSKRAVEVNIQIMRAFVKLRELIASNIGLAKRLDELEKRRGAVLAPDDRNSGGHPLAFWADCRGE